MSADTAGSAAKRHDALWFDDGNIVLQAENTLFCVHRSVLKRESQLFSDMFAVPQPSADGLSVGNEGTEANPIPLHQVGAEAMANILTMLYTAAGVHLTLDNAACMAVLRAAHRLQFQSVQDGFVPLLPARLSAEERLHLGLSDCGVDDWALPAFKELVFSSDLHDGSGPPLIGHASWNIIYKTRVQVLGLRMSASAHLLSSNYCAQHIHFAWDLLTGTSDTSIIRKQLQPPQAIHTSYRMNINPQKCDAGRPGCWAADHMIVHFLRKNPAGEDELIAGAWAQLQDEYSQ